MKAILHHGRPQLLDPSRSTIRNVTAHIREDWSLGERHNRARMALLLQTRLFQQFRRANLFDYADR